MADIVLINPRFEVSYWGMERAMPLLGKRAALPVAGLPLLAALTPACHSVTIVDENVEPIDFDRCARADFVGVTGMSVQRLRMREILAELKRRGCFTVVGGAYVTVEETYFGDLADVVFVGEAERTWPQFLDDWGRGERRARYEQDEPTDMTRVPPPRLDLLKMRHYAFGSVQFSRGCPFQCDFCDIIVTFGRRPRIKGTGQILAELDAVRAQGSRIVFIVDDNLVGDRRAIKHVLREVAAWQEARGYPLIFTTEASIDLADDPELMRLMVEANVTSVFVGIESPNLEALREARKYQNLRAGGGLLEKVHRIQRAGLEVWCGMILGFDSDDETIFDAQREFLREARIPTTMIGMLNAIPKTPLHARLASEGRLLDWSADSSYGTNVVPLRMTREQLRDGYVQAMADLYEPGAYFGRLEALLLGERISVAAAWVRHWGRNPWRKLRDLATLMAMGLGLFARLMTAVPDPALRREYRSRFMALVRDRRDPIALVFFLFKCALHYHAHTMARDMAGRGRIYNSG